MSIKNGGIVKYLLEYVKTGGGKILMENKQARKGIYGLTDYNQNPYLFIFQSVTIQ